MPRVAQQPHGTGRHAVAATPHKSPMKIPLNDDRQEKAARLQSRQALQEMQMNQIKAAATPLRKRKSFGGAQDDNPNTSMEKENEGGYAVVGGSVVTPMKRVPILANFEEWMKMATDNKINATNSWNFALIDYFHDMSLLKEGNSVNFQKASCTLDGCVKIYTSRVDSVATETGKLLSGLADGGTKRRKGEEEEGGGQEDGEDEEEEDGTKKKARKRTQRSSEATLVDSFEKLQLKKIELEFSVDPLFKKASADFDEGGAKGLLLNHLAIDGQGRIIFDSSDEVQDASAAHAPKDRTHVDQSAHDEQTSEERDTVVEERKQEDVEIDLGALAAKFFPDLSILDSQDICPSLKNFDLGDPSGSLDIPFLKAPDDWRKDSNQEKDSADAEKTVMLLDDDNLALAFDDDDDGPLAGGFDLPPDTGFGEGGEAWAKEAALEPQLRVYNNGPLVSDSEADCDVAVGALDANASHYAVTLDHPQHTQSGSGHDDILAYFDTALSRNWAGPEHWRIRRIKSLAISKNTLASNTVPKRKEKVPFEINFAAPMTQQLADQLYTKASSASNIYLPKKEWKSKTRNLLPDDKHFNSRTLLRLFLKPKARIGAVRRTGGAAPMGGERRQADFGPGEEMDEQFWARRNAEEAMLNEQAAAAEDTAQAPNYDANFFQDDGLGGGGGMDDDADDDFADAREEFSPVVNGGVDEGGGTGREGQGIDQALEGVPSSQATEGAFGTQLVTQSRRLRPEYVQYARVAKKVDVRRLKEEMWRGIGFEKTLSAQPPHHNASPPTLPPEDEPDPNPPALKFTDVMNGLKSVYSPSAMADISTSYCFICLLHLANEKGLVLSNEERFQDLGIRKDESAEIVVGGE